MNVSDTNLLFDYNTWANKLLLTRAAALLYLAAEGCDALIATSVVPGVWR